MELVSLKDFEWEADYRTSSVTSEGKPVDILHDFYLPALERSVQYDRVAGYFRSSSLAAASQGFTKFLANEGNMRLIVGADMALEDVAAILEGNSQRLSDKLMKELEDEEAWTEEVKSGVALLSEMVACGRLEVRVAFRINANTGKAVSIDSVDDGYVHEKWFIMTDSYGDSIYCSGSINESRTALTINAENVHVTCEWDGPKFKNNVEKARADFEAFWNNHNPHMRVYTLPEAVKLKLVKLRNLRNVPTEIDGTVIDIEPKISNEELLKFAVLKDAPKMPNGIYVGMYSAPVDPWPHQEAVARRLIETYPYSYMMCDEVGLGKTIEAALAMRSLILSGRAKRVLILAPAGLTAQWHNELADKTMLPFARSWNKFGTGKNIISEWVYPAPKFKLQKNLFKENLNIVSSALAQRQERKGQLESAEKFDIVLLDEAHYARRSNPNKHIEGAPKYNNLYKLINNNVQKSTRALWLATATPMQIDAVEAYDLLRLTKRSGPFMEDPGLCMRYFDLLLDIISNEKMDVQKWGFLGQAFVQIEMLDNYLWDNLHQTVIDGRNERVLKNMSTKIPRSVDVKNLRKPLFAASPLARVMQRHTRALLELYRDKGELNSNLAKRIIRPLAIIEFTPLESDFYNSLQDYCSGLREQMLKYNKETKDALGFLLNFLQLRFASSLNAIKLTLERRLRKVKNTLLVGAKKFESQEELDEVLQELEEISDSEDGYSEVDFNDITLDALLKDRTVEDLNWEQERLEKMIAKLNAIVETPSKIKRLLEEIELRKSGERVKQMVVFTRFYDSLESIRAYLLNKEPRLRIGIYSGSKVSYFDSELGRDVVVTRDYVKQLFRAGEIDILLCTDAAAEGLNLQTADLLINFDLGWNPMKIEQRIGRIDRIGQKYDTVEVLNMCYLGSAEEVVYGRLFSRLTEANYIVGTQQVSMLPVTADQFKQLQNGELSEEELTIFAKEKLEQEKRQVASMELSAQDIYDIYKRLSNNSRRYRLPAYVENIWDAFSNSKYLKQRGVTVSGSELTVSSSGLGDLKYTNDRTKVSENVKYLTWGSDLTDMIFDRVDEELEEKQWVKRITVEKDNIILVGYVVATTSGIRLVTGYEQLADVQVDESITLSQDDINRYKNILNGITNAESSRIIQKETAVANNIEFAEINSKLVRFAAAGVIEAVAFEHKFDHYSDVFKKIMENPKRSYRVLLPKDVFDGKGRMLLFNTQNYNNEISLAVNGMLLEIVISCMQREVEGIHQKRNDILVKDIVRKLIGRN